MEDIYETVSPWLTASGYHTLVVLNWDMYVKDEQVTTISNIYTRQKKKKQKKKTPLLEFSF